MSGFMAEEWGHQGEADGGAGEGVALRGGDDGDGGVVGVFDVDADGGGDGGGGFDGGGEGGGFW